MKLHLANTGVQNAFTAYGDGYVQINATRHAGSVIVGADFVEPWPATAVDDLGPDHFVGLAARRPQVLVIGSGKIFRFPTPAQLRPLIEARIGYEVMDTQAACRTYNILLGEGRNVLAAVLVEA